MALFYQRDRLFASGGAMGAFDEIGQVRRVGHRCPGRWSVRNEMAGDGCSEARDAFTGEGGNVVGITRCTGIG